MKNNDVHNRQQGLTLIEILIAMVLGIFLIAGVAQIFLSSQKNYRMQDNLSRMQENGRFAMDFISRDLRMAGLQGCTKANPNNIIDPGGANLNPTPVNLLAAGSLPLMGSDNVDDDWNTIACGPGDECTEDSDVITYHYGQYCANLMGNMGTVNANIQIPAGSSCDIQPYDLLLISSCSNADIFIAVTASSGGGIQTIPHSSSQNTVNFLSTMYDTNAQVFKLLSSTFFIRTGANGLPALWKMNNAIPASSTNPVELVEGIEDMQILYGADTDGNGTPDYYVTAGTAALDMDTVVSVRISLLVASFDEITSKYRAYTYNGITTTPTDYRLRRIVSSTIAVRNQLP